jgi:hypothetical protein
MPHSRTLVLAFDGDASAADLIGRLTNRFSADVVTVTVDLGQGGDLEQAREQALAAIDSPPRYCSPSSGRVPRIRPRPRRRRWHGRSSPPWL